MVLAAAKILEEVSFVEYCGAQKFGLTFASVDGILKNINVRQTKRKISFLFRLLFLLQSLS